jgi:putative flippase GtrA
MADSKRKKLASSRFSRFIGVGVLNTLLDFTLLNILLAVFGHGSNSTVVLYNTISATTVALLSFFLNRAFVFKSKHTPHHYALYFILITLAGLYVVQNSIIYAFLHWFDGLAGWAANVLGHGGIGLSKEFILVNSAKAVATLGSMTWNYIWYKKAIFKPKAGQPL